jgi:hypothetical protein
MVAMTPVRLRDRAGVLRLAETFGGARLPNARHPLSEQQMFLSGRFALGLSPCRAAVRGTMLPYKVARRGVRLGPLLDLMLHTAPNHRGRC